MKLYALVKLRPQYDPNAHYHFISSDLYDSKSEFAKDLHGNGFIIWHNKIYTENEYNNI